MILSDVVPFSTPSSAGVTHYQPEVEATETLAASLKLLRALQPSQTGEQALGVLERKGMAQIGERVLQSTLAGTGGTLPEALYKTLCRFEQQGAAKVAMTPQASLAKIRDIVDQLGFLIIPYAYLDAQSYAAETTSMREAIKAFAAQTSQWFTPYVVTPPVYYSVEAHAAAEQDLPIYSGPLTAQAMMALSMSMPMFRTLLRNLQQLAKEHKEIQQQLQGVKQEIAGVKQRLQALETLVEQHLQAAIRREEEARAREANIRAESRRQPERFLAYEPMLIGIPHKHTVTSDCNVIVGPCWGPDFDDMVFTALNLSKVEGQRDSLKQVAGIYAGVTVRERHEATEYDRPGRVEYNVREEQHPIWHNLRR